MWNIRRRWKSTGQNSRCGIFEEDGTSQGGPSACAWCRDPYSWWHGARIAIRNNSIQIPQAGTWRLRTSHTRTIAYPIRICCLDHCPKLLAFRICMANDFKASVLHVSELSIALPWIPKNSPQSWIALVIKLLTKNTKTYTIWLELIARVLNMLIGLKCNNYCSKVFKRVNYKLWTSTFWVVISHHSLRLLYLVAYESLSVNF